MHFNTQLKILDSMHKKIHNLNTYPDYARV